MKQTWYDEDEDVLNVGVQDGAYWKSIELPNGVVVDIDRKGTVLSIEIIRASEVFSGKDSLVLENAKKVTVPS